MKRLKARLRKITSALNFTFAKLHFAQARYKRLRAQGHALKAQLVLGHIKELQQHKHGLQKNKAEVKALMEEWLKEHKITIDGDKVTGGTVRQRIVAAALAAVAKDANGTRHSFYSQAGVWDVNHCITGPTPGHRDDCSSWLTSAYKSAGAQDPNDENYEAGYTGTLYGGTTPIYSSQLEPGDIIIYGRAPGHHTELYVGNGRTVGHGDARVNFGVTDLFGDGAYYCRRAPGV